MKNIYTLAIACALNSTLSTHAYEFSFHNGTEVPIAIAIQYTGNDGIKEPLYKQLVKPQSMVTFTPGEKGIPEIKWGFCLDQIYYVENPTQEQKNNVFEKAPWRKATITWVKEKSTTKRNLMAKKTSTAQKTVSKEIIVPYYAETPMDRTTTPAEKSLCRDRHFDIIRDERQKIAITSSLAE